MSIVYNDCFLLLWASIIFKQISLLNIIVKNRFNKFKMNKLRKLIMRRNLKLLKKKERTYICKNK